MNAMKSAKATRILAFAALLGPAINFAACAQSASSAADAGSPASLMQGEVRKVDQENHKITLKHDAIRNLDMPPMTMVFQVREPALLDKVHVGDKVLFAAIQDGGKLTVTRIEAAK